MPQEYISSNAFYFTFCLKLSELNPKAVNQYPLNTRLYCAYLMKYSHGLSVSESRQRNPYCVLFSKNEQLDWQKTSSNYFFISI